MRSPRRFMNNLCVWLNILLCLAIIAVILWGGWVERPGRAQQAVEDQQRVVMPIRDANGIVNTSFSSPLPTREDKHGLHPEPFTANAPDSTAAIPNHTAPSQGCISLMVVDLGLDDHILSQALHLPSSVSLGFSPYGQQAPTASRQAAQAGHEVLVKIPLEPQQYPVQDPGPYGLLTHLSNQQNLHNLEWILSRVPNAAGTYSVISENIMLSPDRALPILEALGQKKLYLVFKSSENAEHTVSLLAEPLNISVMLDVVMLDGDLSPGSIAEQMQILIEKAQTQGKAVGVASAYPVLLQAIHEWIARFPTYHIKLVPISVLLKSPTDRE